MSATERTCKRWAEGERKYFMRPIFPAKFMIEEGLAEVSEAEQEAVSLLGKMMEEAQAEDAARERLAEAQAEREQEMEELGAMTPAEARVYLRGCRVARRQAIRREAEVRELERLMGRWGATSIVGC